ncbi:redoxin domain-containing protein [Alkalicella caledoniensis]|uniref:Redoxin domain-containing protein n=1 Tax=Alkalicella caledoniensis TaxID=2731377 RepID=A0A7G9WC82_ALKCA|nr:redoxin domain-containing protein [Alkalicella caledoniensis]QNO16294.1 redoxin domain-containing protein [Alkalicella caledoniensis]
MKSKKLSVFLLIIIVSITGYFLVQDYIFSKDVGSTGDNLKNKNVETGINVGQLAPNFKLNSLSGESYELSDFKGKIVMLNFWSITCPPCIEEMPHMQEVYNDYKDSDFEILAVNLDRNMKEVELYVDHFDYDFLVLEGDGDIERTFMVRFIPKTLFIDPHGIIYYEHVGAMDYEQIVKKIKEIR